MSILSRILAFANIIVAIVLIYFAAQVYVARLAWQKALRQLEERRDGISTSQLLLRVRQDFPEQVEALEKEKPQSEAALRIALLKILFPPDKPDLLADSNRTESLKDRYGLSYDDVRSVVEDQIGRLRNELAIEEQTLLHRRRELESLRAQAETAIREAEQRWKSLQQQVKAELDQHEKIRQLIHQRRLQIAFWLARLCEAYATREVAAAKLSDMQAEHERLRRLGHDLEKTCLQLQEQITQLERKLQSRSNP